MLPPPLAAATESLGVCSSIHESPCAASGFAPGQMEPEGGWTPPRSTLATLQQSLPQYMISDTGLWRCCLQKHLTLGAAAVTISTKSQGFSEENVLVAPGLSCLAAGLALLQ